MLVSHKHIPAELLADKREVELSRLMPLVVVVNSHISFLNNTIRAVFREYGYPFEERQAESHELMGYTLPIICYENVVLEQEAVI